MGISGTKVDPAVALVRDGEISCFIEEERLVRVKHANGLYPINSLKYCLDKIDWNVNKIVALGVNWDLNLYGNNFVRDYFLEMNKKYHFDDATREWQDYVIKKYSLPSYRAYHQKNWSKAFGSIDLPPFHIMNHHYVHAAHAFLQSPFDEAICITIDGSGETDCTVLWDCSESKIKPILRIGMPNSLGWYYAAFTEYLGFKAYDGEYKVMGMAAYGKYNHEISTKIDSILHVPVNSTPPVYVLNPYYIHYGEHNWSGRFTDNLPNLLGWPPRLPGESIQEHHMDIAYAVQSQLEKAVMGLVKWGLRITKKRNLCVGGGVGLNVKMNSRLFYLPEVQGFFAQPLCSDSGAAAGSALTAFWHITGQRPKQLLSLSLGKEFKNEEIEKTLNQCGITYSSPKNLLPIVAELLSENKIIGWFQGKMEAGPRSLGYRSILANPQKREIVDIINSKVKMREYWRPLCPSILSDDAELFISEYQSARFMNVSFTAKERMKVLAPAVVHIDGSSRIQVVYENENPLFYQLLKEFKKISGIAILLNTSFNTQGEPIVCNVKDALRTFYSSGIDNLVCGKFLISK